MHIHKHVNFFAPVFICLVFGVAIVAMFPVVFQPTVVSRATTYDDCAKMAGSRVQQTYPPICVTKEGKSYTKDLPAVQIPVGQQSR